jgi:23S rRNA (cytidine1920-2'-O)/16S rRNA (cytidine1409-2'-O)-methyltransferase
VVQAFVAVLRAEPEFPTPQLVLLVKPQFEAGRSEVSKGRGVITDPAVHLQACETVSEALVALGCTVRGIVESPIKGAEGNTEFLLFADCPTSSVGLVS